jgi:hypothetical protein
MNPDDEAGAETGEPESPQHPLLARPSGRARWLTVAAFLVAAAFAVWRCG